MLGHGLTEFGIGHGYGYGLYGPYGPQPMMASTMGGPMMVGPIGQPIAAHMGHIGAPGMAPLMSLMGPVGPMPMMRHASHGVMPGQMLASGIGPINAPPAPRYLRLPVARAGGVTITTASTLATATTTRTALIAASLGGSGTKRKIRISEPGQVAVVNRDGKGPDGTVMTTATVMGEAPGSQVVATAPTVVVATA